MSCRGERHPPKKKARKQTASRARRPYVDSKRNSKAQQEFEKATMHLVEAEQIASSGQAPNACAHSAYYAMYHCAAAAILAAGGVGKRRDVPQSHEHVIQHYGNLIAGEPGFLAQSGMVLSRARDRQDGSDYNLIRGVTAAEAAATVEDAREFVGACKTKWNL